MSSSNLTATPTLRRAQPAGGQTPAAAENKYARTPGPSPFATPASSPSFGFGGTPFGGTPFGATATPQWPSFASPAPAASSSSSLRANGPLVNNQLASPKSPAPAFHTAARPSPPPATVNSASLSSSALPTLATRYQDPTIDQITAQLHRVQQYKTPGNLACSCILLVGGLSLLLYMLAVPMMPRITFLAGLITLSREHVQLAGIFIGGWMAYIGFAGVHGYTSLQLPARAMEQLTERQKQLMGWSTTGSTGDSAHGRVPREEEAALRAQQRRRATHAADVARQQAQQAQQSSTPSSSLASRSSHGAPLSPVPTASLRFLDPRFGQGPPLHSSPSPFKTRGLGATLHDEAALQGFVQDYSARRGDEHAHSAFSTPQAARYGASSLSPRTAFAPSLHTPPYATSMREAASPAVIAPLVGLGHAAHQPFVLPGLRYALSDPRADGELHEAFQMQLRTTLRRSTQELDGSVRRLRAWLVSTVLRPFLRAMEASDASMAALARMILAQPGVSQALTADELALLKELAAARDGPSARSEEAIDLIRRRFPQRPEVIARAPVDAILSVDAQSSRAALVVPSVKAYVARRLLELCAPGDDSLSKYSVQQNGLGGAGANPFTNNRGALFGSGLNKSTGSSQQTGLPSSVAGSVAFPSDAQLIVHVFSAHMEAVVPGFALQYVRDASDPAASAPGAVTGVASLPRPTDGAACIVQVRAAQTSPYFIVARAPASTGSSASRASSAGGVKYVTEPGRASLFQALVLWILELPVGSRLGREFTGLLLADS